MQHFGYLFYYRWEPDFSKPPLCEIRDNMWAIRGLLVVSFWRKTVIIIFYRALFFMAILS